MNPEDIFEKAKAWRLFDHLVCGNRSCMGRMGPEDFALRSDRVQAECPECGTAKEFRIEQLHKSINNLEESVSSE